MKKMSIITLLLLLLLVGVVHAQQPQPQPQPQQPQPMNPSFPSLTSLPTAPTLTTGAAPTNLPAVAQPTQQRQQLVPLFPTSPPTQPILMPRPAQQGGGGGSPSQPANLTQPPQQPPQQQNTQSTDDIRRYIIRLPNMFPSVAAAAGATSSSSAISIHTLSDAQSFLSSYIPSFPSSQITHIYPSPPQSRADVLSACSGTVESKSPRCKLLMEQQIFVVTETGATSSPSPSPPSPMSPIPYFHGFSAFLTPSQLSVLRTHPDTIRSIEEDAMMKIVLPSATATTTTTTIPGHVTTAVTSTVNILPSDSSSLPIPSPASGPSSQISIPPPQQQPHAGTTDSDNTQEPNSSAYITKSWALDRIDQARLPLDGYYHPYKDVSMNSSSSLDGSQVTIYLLDTGCQTSHREFAPYGRAKLVYRSNTAITIDDPNGHGTHTASLAGGVATGSADSDVQIACLRVLDASGSAAYSDILTAMDWLQYNAIGPAVLSMSFGGSYSQALNDMAVQLVKGGLHTVVAMGNSASGTACTTLSTGFSPASASANSAVISIGSSSINDTFSTFSNYGACTTLNSPGENVLGAYSSKGTIESGAVNNTYALLSGTSMATPIVAGVLARYLKRNGDVSPTILKSRLLCSSTKSRLTGIPSNAVTADLVFSDIRKCPGEDDQSGFGEQSSSSSSTGAPSSLSSSSSSSSTGYSNPSPGPPGSGPPTFPSFPCFWPFCR